MSGFGNVLRLIASLGGLVMQYLASLGLVGLGVVAGLGALGTAAHSPKLGVVSAVCGSLAVHAVRRYQDTDGRLAHLLVLALQLGALCLPPLWVVLS